MRLPRRRTILLSAAFLLAVIVGLAWLFAPRSRITQENFDRISKRMKLSEVEQILGKCDGRQRIHVTWTRTVVQEHFRWTNGPNMIWVDIDHGKVVGKQITLVTGWEWVKWYAKKGAAKIGLKWD